ncbi:MAG: preprotein translocase subunit SecG [Oscillospiraceae bacterium]|jgi:preprotein translocase subunit SecG|nr:preprotein translocase subunit SecG [Oscillospiraceae bacterium]
MEWYQIVLAVVTILVSVSITVLVMLQESKAQGLSGVISGGMDNLFGKTKGRSYEDKLVKYTKYLTIAFFGIALGATLLFLFFSRA